MKKLKQSLLMHLLLPIALCLSIPAFYLVLTSTGTLPRTAGYTLYGVVAALVASDILIRRKKQGTSRLNAARVTDIAVLLGALASTLPGQVPWSDSEWLLRLGYCGIVFIRLSTLLAPYVAPHRLTQIVIFALIGLATAGAGFLWLEPQVDTYADGVWLAFTTGATVGYGDLVPSSPASRIFAVFIVLLGYALFSVVTASIAALLVGEDEKRLSREMHADMRLLRKEIAALRAELRKQSAGVSTETSEADEKD